MKNWKDFYKQHLKSNIPTHCSVDVCCAIAAKILDCEEQIVSYSNSSPTFVHMKSRIQNWNTNYNSWQDAVGTYIDIDCNLVIGSYKQTRLFHYTENLFVTPDIINKFRKKLNV